MWAEGLASVLPGQRQHTGVSVGKAGGGGVAGWVEGVGARPKSWEGRPGLPVCTAGGQVRLGLTARLPSLAGGATWLWSLLPRGGRERWCFALTRSLSLSLSCVGGDQPQLTLGCPGSCLINPPSHPVPDVPVHVWPCLVEGQTEVQGGSYSGHVVREG